MTQDELITSELLDGFQLDDFNLSLEEFAKACHVQTNWVTERVEAGILHTLSHQSFTVAFSSTDLIRAKRLINTERDFDANQELAALVVDLIEEVNYLKSKLSVIQCTYDDNG